MKITAKVTLNQSALKQLEQAQEIALEMTGEVIKTDIVTSQVVPKQTGELERSGFVDTSLLKQMKIKIVYDTPYGRRLYWHPEYNFRKDKNPNAQGKWMEAYQSGEKQDFARKAFAAFLKQHSKGLIK
ncbi:hypothetical protein NCCP2222_19210 [Sporosarcina sp. NCCP-2222]|uniref:hypothetical protein n=1 Tax=Sporosarcina sp. NCCP-2222 TaxID=2935073 RepID=UPI00208A2C76|nr:hypothetical protein [Sporosarcina sp. NCCP-2222]GKV55974.1 hypothetical protein NCCP2222_19210 [Sporosarcina sp. NCCP-2222]